MPRTPLVDGQEVRLPKAAELVAASLRRQIVGGHLKEGDLLPREDSLMSNFNVSRPTLREALRILESEGFIRVRRGTNGGAEVQLPTDEIASRYFGALLQSHGTSLVDAFKARSIIEAPAAGLAAAKRNPENLAILRHQIERAEAEFDNAAALFDACNSFHRAVVEVAGNSTLRLMSGLLDRILDRAASAFVVGGYIAEREITPFQQPVISPAHRAHLRLLELIEAGDEVSVEAFWRRHLDHTADAVLNAPNATTVLDLLSSAS